MPAAPVSLSFAEIKHYFQLKAWTFLGVLLCLPFSYAVRVTNNLERSTQSAAERYSDELMLARFVVSFTALATFCCFVYLVILYYAEREIRSTESRQAKSRPLLQVVKGRTNTILYLFIPYFLYMFVSVVAHILRLMDISNVRSAFFSSYQQTSAPLSISAIGPPV